MTMRAGTAVIMMIMLIVGMTACRCNSKNCSGITLDFTLAGGDEGAR
jgi:hypothetical protein